jgi:hypothetical protein
VVTHSPGQWLPLLRLCLCNFLEKKSFGVVLKLRLDIVD